MSDSSHQLARLMQLAVQADDVPTSVIPTLTVFVYETAAVCAAYFRNSGPGYQARAASLLMPTGPIMDGILLHGLPGETPPLRALQGTKIPLFFDDTGRAPETAGFPEP